MRRNTLGSATDAGFTLLEMLVTVTVFGLLMAGLAQGVRFGLYAWTAQAREVARGQDLDTVDRLFRRMIAGMDPGNFTDGPAVIAGGPYTLSFIGQLPLASLSGGAPAPQLDLALGVDAASRLVLRWRPHYRRVIGVLPPPEESELVAGVDHIELSYWRSAVGPGRGGGWQAAWSSPGLPPLVRLRVVFPPGDPRKWPDMVAAPRRMPLRFVPT